MAGTQSQARGAAQETKGKVQEATGRADRKIRGAANSF